MSDKNARYLKMNKTELSFLFLGAIFFIAILVKIFAPSGVWVCYNGEWVKRGAPKEQKPTSTCLVANKPTGASSSQPVTETATLIETPVALGVNLSSPQEGSVVNSPLVVKGEAPGSWFFEGNIVVEIQDNNRQVITTHPGTAQSDWMTDNLVPFASLVEFETQAETGYLIIRNDNPSGLPEFAKEVEWPLIFK